LPESDGCERPGAQAVADAAARAGLELLVVQVETEANLEPAVDRARTWGPDLLTAHYVIPLNVTIERLPTLVRRVRIPASGSRQWTEAGFLLSYDINRVAVYRRGAWYVARG
jgi:hypothetical protein